MHACCVECSGELSCVQHVSNVLFALVCFFHFVLSLLLMLVDVLPSVFFLHLCLLSTIPIFFSIYLKFSYLLSMFIRRSIIYMCMRSCIDIENLCFFCSPFFSSNIFYLFFPSERTRIVESFIQFFFLRFDFVIIFVRLLLLLFYYRYLLHFAALFTCEI